MFSPINWGREKINLEKWKMRKRMDENKLGEVGQKNTFNSPRWSHLYLQIPIIACTWFPLRLVFITNVGHWPEACLYRYNQSMMSWEDWKKKISRLMLIHDCNTSFWVKYWSCISKWALNMPLHSFPVSNRVQRTRVMKY